MSDEQLYFVNDIYLTIQGEGVHTGVPSVFIRLHGCNVGCPFCDTKETWHFEQGKRVESIVDALGKNSRYTGMYADEIADYIKSNWPHITWAVITGGEPATHLLKPLVEALNHIDMMTALETSGTESIDALFTLDWITVSPKFNMPSGKRVLAGVLGNAHEIKHVVGRESDIQQLDAALSEITLGDGVIISLQPMSLSKKATQLCLKIVQERNWRLSLQTHQMIQIP